MKISVPPYAERDGFLSPNLKTINLKLKKVFKSSPFEIELKARPKTRAAGILWKLDFELFLREKSLFGQTCQETSSSCKDISARLFVNLTLNGIALLKRYVAVQNVVGCRDRTELWKKLYKAEKCPSASSKKTRISDKVFNLHLIFISPTLPN